MDMEVSRANLLQTAHDKLKRQGSITGIFSYQAKQSMERFATTQVWIDK